MVLISFFFEVQNDSESIDINEFPDVNMSPSELLKEVDRLRTLILYMDNPEVDGDVSDAASDLVTLNFKIQKKIENQKIFTFRDPHNYPPSPVRNQT